MTKFNRKKVSEFGGKGVEKSTVHAKSQRALTAEERRRLIVRTGTENPLAEPAESLFHEGRRPPTDA